MVFASIQAVRLRLAGKTFNPRLQNISISDYAADHVVDPLAHHILALHLWSLLEQEVSYRKGSLRCLQATKVALSFIDLALIRFPQPSVSLKSLAVVKPL